MAFSKPHSKRGSQLFSNKQNSAADVRDDVKKGDTTKSSYGTTNGEAVHSVATAMETVWKIFPAGADLFTKSNQQDL